MRWLWPFKDASNLQSYAQVERIRRRLMRSGEKNVWVDYPSNSNFYENPLPLNLYQRVVEVLYPLRIDKEARFVLIIEPSGELILKRRESGKQEEK